VAAQAWGRDVQQYKVIDAALGRAERDARQVADAVDEKPSLANGPIPIAFGSSLCATSPDRRIVRVDRDHGRGASA
jgi:transmembrane protein DUF3556